MREFIFRISLYLVCFAGCFWAFLGIDFERIIRKGKTAQAQMIVVLLSMAAGYLVAQFIMSLMYRNIFY